MGRFFFSTILILSFVSPIVAQSPEVTVMTYNIRVGLGMGGSWSGHDPTENLAEIAGVIRESGAEIVLLQEVDNGVERTQGLDEAATLGDELGLNHLFAPAMEFGGGAYGIALLTSWEIASHETIHLFKPDYSMSHPELPDYFSEQRVALVAEFASGDHTLTVINTHLGLTADQRVPQLSHIGEMIQDRRDEGRIVFGGDLNCEPDAHALLPIRVSLNDCYQGFTDDRGLERDMPIAERLTFPADEPVRCIDYLFHHGVGEVLETRVIETTASDHRPVVSRFALSPPPH